MGRITRWRKIGANALPVVQYSLTEQWIGDWEPRSGKGVPMRLLSLRWYERRSREIVPGC